MESDFETYVGDYAVYSETDNLLRVLLSAINNQLQNIRAFDAIELILINQFKKLWKIEQFRKKNYQI